MVTATETDPEFEAANAAAGAAYVALYDYGEGGPEMLDLADAQLEAALRRNPSNARALRSLSVANFLRGRSQPSLRLAADAGAVSDPYDAGLLLARAVAYGSSGLLDESLPLIDKVIGLEPMNEAALRFLAVAKAWKGDSDGAIEAGEAYLLRFGEELEIRTYLGLANHASGNAAAAEHYRLAVDLARQTESASGAAARAFLYAGIYFSQQGQSAQAQRWWREALRDIGVAMRDESADNPGVLLYRAMFELLLGVRPLSDPVIEAVPSDGFVLYQRVSLAATYAFLGEAARAAELLEEDLRLGSSAPRWKLLVGVASPTALESAAFEAFARDFENRINELRGLFWR